MCIEGDLKNASFQFDYLISVNGILSKSQEIIPHSRRLLIQEDCPQFYNWDEYGLRLDFAEHAENSISVTNGLFYIVH